MQDYLLVDSREPYVLHNRKLDVDTRVEKTYNSLEQVMRLDNLDARLAKTDVYAHMEFDPELRPLP